MTAGGTFDFQKFVEQTTALQKRMEDAQAALRDAAVTESSADGGVTLTLTTSGEVTELRIDPALADPDRIAVLEDSVREAFGRATASLRDLTDRMFEPFGEFMGGVPDQ